jgi:hypothetical protein
MPTAHRQKTVARAAPKKAPARRPAPVRKSPPASKKPAPATPKPTPPAKPAGRPAAKASVPDLQLPSPDGRRHLLSLSFVRDGDEFLARLETDSGHITELKNRSLDQLLTLVASELEDLLE